MFSIRYTEKSAVVDEEDPEDSGETLKLFVYFRSLSNLNYRFKFVLHIQIQTSMLSGDNLVSMLLKPSYTTQESEKVRYN